MSHDEPHPGASPIVVEGSEEALALSRAGAPLVDALTVLVRTIERESPDGVLGSILLLDEDGKHLRHGAAPSLPSAYNRAIDGLAIGPTVGSCGTAAHGGHTVMVYDIATDPLWADFKQLALAHDLRSCWSSPIRSTGGAILGTFALYQRVPAAPSVRDRELVEHLGKTAALVIERARAAKSVQATGARA